MEKVIIFGTGAVTEVVHFYLTHDSCYEVAGFTADRKYIEKDTFMGLPLIAFDEVEKTFPPYAFKMFVALSYRKMNKVRAERYRQAKEKGYALISYVSSKATTWPGLTIGDNTFIFENNVIQLFVKIGSDVIMWSGNHIGHHAQIGDHCFVSSHVVVCGGVVIEPMCFIGVNATIKEYVKICEESLVGAQALILKDTEPKSVYYKERGAKTALFKTGRFLKI